MDVAEPSPQRSAAGHSDEGWPGPVSCKSKDPRASYEAGFIVWFTSCWGGDMSISIYIYIYINK